MGDLAPAALILFPTDTDQVLSLLPGLPLFPSVILTLLHGACIVKAVCFLYIRTIFCSLEQSIPQAKWP